MIDPRLWTFAVPAAGQGERMGEPKAFLEIGGRTLLDWSIEKARAVSDDIVIALPSGPTPELAERYPDCRFIAGGGTRQDSVKALIGASAREWIMVHDVARPLASAALFAAVAEAAGETGAAGAFGPLSVPVAIIADGRVVGHHGSAGIGLFQTPLAFRKDVLVAAYEAAERERRQERSTIELVLKAGFEVRAVTGEARNIKITYPEDLDYARLLAARD